MKKASKRLEAALKQFALFFLGVYRTAITTHLGGACRFSPSCSQYAIDAVKTLPLHRALFYIIKRLFRCRPLGPYGYDPVPSINTEEK